MQLYFLLFGAACTNAVLWLLGDNTIDLAGNCNQSGYLTLRGCLMEDDATVDFGFLQKIKASCLVNLVNKSQS